MEQMIPSTLPNGTTGMRIAPRMAPTAYRSFDVYAPRETHYRKASCREVECQHHLAGWSSTFDVNTPEGRKWANAIARSGRKYTVTEVDGTTTFRFPAGQSCFQAPHMVPTGRPEIFVVRDGDWRGNPTGRADKGVRPLEFVERMAENLDNLNDAIRRG